MDRIIETQRLLLRPLRVGDAPAIAQQINTRAIIHNLARVPFPYGLADAEEFLGWAMPQQERTRFSAICLKQDPAMLRGSISYEWRAGHNCAELGYWLAEPLWGRGLMSEAVGATVRHAFDVAGIDTVTASYFTANPASGAVLRKNGFEDKGDCTVYCRARAENVAGTLMQLAREKAAW